MIFEELEDNQLELIVGGSIYDMEMYMGIFCAIATLVAIFKIYASSKGKFSVGKDYSFEWA